MFSYVIKTLIRHRARTLLTISGTAVALFVFCFVAAVQRGMHSLTSYAEADRSLVVFQENRFCPSTSRLPVGYAAEIAKLNGVRDVMPIQVWTNNCRASLDVIVFHGVNPQQLQTHRNLELIQGDWQPFLSQRNVAIVGRNVANRRGLSVGDQFSIGPLSVQVVGLFRSNVPGEESLIYAPLDYLQFAYGSDQAGLVTQHEVFLMEEVDPDRKGAEIDQLLRANSVPTKTRRKGAFLANAVSDLVDLIDFANWLGYACVGLVLSIVATTTVMNVQDRIKEYAVLQTIGVRPLRTMGLVLTEATILSSAGGLLGMGAAILFLYFSQFSITAEGVAIPVAPSWQLGVLAGSISVVVGLLAGIAPAIQAATVSIVTALRQE